MFTIGMENTQAFWVALIVGGALALALGGLRCAKAGVEGRRVALATVLLPLLAAFFSHLLYGLADLENVLYTYSFGYLFAFWEKGYMLYGGMLGVLLALLLCGGKRRAAMLEAYAPSGALMIAAARVCEGLLGQGYGEYFTDESALRRFPFMVYDAYYEEWCWALFVLEALVALAIFVWLLCRKPTWRGDGTLLLAGLYAGAQIVLDSLRRDEFLRWGVVRVEEVVSAVVVLGVLIFYCARSPRGKRLQKALCFALYAAMIVLCLLLEFATEGRIPFLLFLDVDACYIAMAVACAALMGCVLWMRRLSNAPQPAQGKESYE